MEQLCRDGADDQEGSQDQPIERITDNESVMRRNEEPVEEQEGRTGESQAKGASTPDAAPQYHEQVDECDMSLVQVGAEREHGQRDRRQPQEGPNPGKSDLLAYSRGATSAEVAKR
jgi:hypothetical protein